MKKYLAIIVINLMTVHYGFSQCQNITPQISTTSVTPTVEVDGNGETVIYYDICQGDNIEFEASATYEDGSAISTPATYTWNNNGGIIQIGSTATYNFPNSGGYEIGLDVQDADDCENDEIVKAFVRVSTTPIIELTAEPNIICAGQNSDLQAIANIEPVHWASPPCEDEFSEPLYLPDGNGVSYETDINLSCFAQGQTLNNISDLLNININIEHSYTGDLDIYLTAPNGAEITLFEQAGGGTWFGEASDNDNTPNNPGDGWDYGWSMNPSYNGTMANGMFNNTTTVGGFFGNEILNSDTYLPIENFNTLLGTQLNGTWTLTVTDNIGQDNGWVFSWGLDINPDIIPANLDWSFTPTIVSNEWTSAPSTVSIAGDQMTVNPAFSGIHEYDYAVTDNFGCTYTETAQIEAVNGPQDFTSSSIPDNCTQGIGSITLEGVGGLAPYTYSWPSINQNGATAQNLNSGTYPFIITDANGCTFEDIAFVEQEGEEIEIEVIETTDDACETGIGTMLVNPLNGVPPYSYDWDNSNSTTSLGTNLETGLQSVIVTDLEGCQGEISYEIGNIPPPTPEFSFNLDSCTNDLSLYNQTDDVEYLKWQIGNLATSFEENPIVHLQYGSIYPITLTVTNEFCSDSLTEVIDLSLIDIYSRIKFPNVFTPNDDYSNDLYIINGLKDCDTGVLRIFNRWGEEVYYTLYPSKEHWNGKKLGEDVKEGVYFYVLKLKYGQLKGSFSLFR